VRLQADTRSSFSISSSILNIAAEPISLAVQPSLHQRDDGVMLRWNVTEPGSFFIRILSSSLDTPYSLKVVATPTYHWRYTDSFGSPQHAETVGDMAVNGVISMPLPFSFSFFGETYRNIWITSAGYVTFEQPNMQPALDFANIHSAAMAAVGVFDMRHPNAH
jgi:hypothetical protein